MKSREQTNEVQERPTTMKSTKVQNPVHICDRVRGNQPYVGEINFEIRAFIATFGIY